MISGDLAARLQRLDSCAVSDALDRLGLAGVVTGLEPRSCRRRIAGRVVTLQLGAGTPRKDRPQHLGTAAIEVAQAGDVIVIEQRTGIDAACWGGILTLAAKLRGIAGVIADGPVRDIDEARQHEFPVFARSLTPHTARGRIAEVATGLAVRIGEVNVEMGDYVIADGSGVAFIQAASAAAVIAAAEEIIVRESAMAEELRRGKPPAEVMGARYENMLRK